MENREYHNRPFKALEMEQQAHVRKLVRQGKALLLVAYTRNSFGDLQPTTYVYVKVCF